ncbi:MAG: BsaWI family type II restriction enzyme, partial [Candidatus Falkowbacteria bacterium]|nr:BsaWI family type II restriction enzyme [Candidatus Falkowbacteria bacterium]
MINLSSTFEQIVIPLIEEYQNKYGGKNIHEYFFDILSKARTSFESVCTKDKGQSWKNESGELLENLVVYFIQKTVIEYGYDLTSDNVLEKSETNDSILSKVYRNVVVRYGKYSVIPDGDIIIFNPMSGEVKAIISCKNSLRERFTQTLYWKLKLSLDPITAPIKMYFVTIDKEDGKKPALDID